MAKPHHFVFNELSRAINKGVPKTALVDALIKKGVIRDADKEKYTGRNGMNYLTAYFRSRDFDTFVHFVECIRKVEETNPTLNLVEPIVKALQTYDKEHGSSYAERISFEKEERVQTLTQAEPQTQTQTIAAQVEGTTSVTEEPVTSSPLGSEHQPDEKQKPVPVTPTTVDQMPGILEDSISKAVVYSNGNTLSSFPYGYEIIIPPRAVPEEKPITLEVGVSTHGPYTLPQDRYRITDFLCVFADGEFQSPVTVSLSHCLELPEYKQTSSIAVMRADMDEINDNGEYIFRQLDFHPDISDTDSTLSFKLKNFCVLCSVYNYESSRSRSYERQGSSTDSVGTAAAHLVRQVAIDDPSSDGAASPSMQTSVEDRDGPYRVRVGSGSVPPTLKRSTEEDDNPHLTSSGEMFVPKTKVKQKRSSKRRTYAPYNPCRPSTPSVQYKFILCEPAHFVGRSFEVHIYACLDCPGSIQACMNQSKECKYTSQEFYFESDKVQFQLVNPTSGWTAKPKVFPMIISQKDIQRYVSHSAAASLVKMGEYPPRKVFTVTWTDPIIQPSTVGDVCQVRVSHTGSDSLVCEFTVTVPQQLPMQVPAASHLSSPWQPYPSGAVNPCLQPDVYSQSYTGAVPPSLPPFNHEAFAGAMQQPSWSYNHPEPNTMFMNTVPTYPTWEHVPVHHPALGGTMPVLQPNGTIPFNISTPLNSRSSDHLQRSLSNEQKQSLSKQVDREVFLKLCKHVMRWKMLGRHLGLDNAKLEQLDSDHKNDSREATYSMLYDWGKINDENATYQMLLDALTQAEENQAIQSLLDNLSQLQ